jgi:hypothetical protein
MSVLTPLPVGDSEKQLSFDDKANPKDIEVIDEDDDSNFGVLENERDIATHVITIHDDPTLNPWTVRAFIIGIGLSAFGGVLGTFLYFTPHLVFLTIFC